MARSAALALALALAGALAGSAHATARRGAKSSRHDASKSSRHDASKSSRHDASKSSRHRARRASSASARVTRPRDAADSPAYRYARLSPAACEAELASRQIDFVREAGAAVLAPVRLTGPLHGVVFRTDQPDEVRPTSPYEIADCRLALALDDFAEILARHDIVEVRHYSIYRPPRVGPDDKIGAQHVGALAIDAGRFIAGSGAVLDVDRDFHGAIGAPICGDGAAPRPATPAALALRAILCEAVERRLFNVVLTPNYNRPHKNHFHLEVTAGAAWFFVH